MKGVPFVNRRDIKGVPFLSKIVNKRIKGLDLWAEPPYGDKLGIKGQPPLSPFNFSMDL